MVWDGAPKVHHYPSSSPPVPSTLVSQPLVTRAVGSFSSLPRPSHALSCLWPSLSPSFSLFSVFPFFSLFFCLARWLSLSEFRLKLRFDLNPNFRLYEKGCEINNVWDVAQFYALRFIGLLDEKLRAKWKWLLSLGLISAATFAHPGGIR